MKRLIKYLIFLCVVLVALAGIMVLTGDASADTHVWDGEGADALASNALNWNVWGVGDDIAPIAGDDVVFNGTSNDACTWDIAATFGTFTLTAGNSAVVAQGAVDFTTSDFTWAGGTWTPKDSNTHTVTGNVAFNGGSLSAWVWNLKMTGVGKTLGGTSGDNLLFRGLQIESGASVSLSHNTLAYGGGIIHVHGALALTGEFTIYIDHVNEIVMDGAVSGTSLLTFQAEGGNTILSITGAISCPVRMTTEGGSAADRTITLGNNLPLTSTLLIDSASATRTTTFDVNGKSLSATSITVNARGIVSSSAAGAKVTTTGSIAVFVNGQIDATNIVWMNCGTDFASSTGTWIPGTNQVNMTGTGIVVLSASQTFYNLNVVGTTTVSVDITVSNSLTISPGGGLSITGSKTVYDDNSSAFSNLGTVSGLGTLAFRFNGADGTLTLGTVSTLVTIQAKATATGNRICSLAVDTVFGATLVVSSAHASNTMTFNLAAKSFTVTALSASTRGVISSTVAGARITITGGLVLSSNGELDATNIRWIVAGPMWDTSGGIWKPGTNQVNTTSSGTTKTAAGQYFYDLLSSTVGVSRTLLSNIVVQNHHNIAGGILQGLFTITINGTSDRPFEANGTWTGTVNITSSAASYTVWTTISTWTGTLYSSKPMTIIFTGGQLEITPPASTWYNITMKGWTIPLQYIWYAGCTNPTANLTFLASGLVPNTGYNFYLDGVFSAHRTSSVLGVLAYYHATWSGHMMTLSSFPGITSGAPSTSILEDLAYYYNATADQTGTWSIVTTHVWMAVGSGTGEITGTPDNTHVSIRAVSLQLTNANGTAYLNWTLTVVNVAPVFLTSAPTTITQLSNYSYDANSTDDGFGAGYSLNEPTGQITLDGSTGIMYGAIYLYQNISIIFWVDDGNGGVTYQNFTLVVFQAISSTPGTVILEDQVYSYWGISNQTGTWALVSNATFLYLAGNLVCGTGNNLYAAQWYVVNLTFTNANGSAWQNWTLNVTNVAPVFTTLPPTENGVQGNRYYYDPTCDDEGIGVVYSMVTVSADLRCDPASGVVQGRFMDVFASLTISIMADDGNGGFSWQNWTIEVLHSSYVIHVEVVFKPGQKNIVHFEYTTDLEPFLFDKVVWNFGDGIGSVDQTPNHIYERVGWYYVTCAVYDVFGNVGYKTVKVGAGNPEDQATQFEKLALWLQSDFIMMLGVLLVGFLGATGYSRYTKKTKGGPNFWIIVIWISVCLVLGLMIGGRFLWTS